MAAPLRGGAVFRWETAGAGVLILVALGCAGNPPTVRKRLQGLDDFHRIVAPAQPVGYRGCDPGYHYFCVPAGHTYTIPRKAWAVTSMPIELGFCIPLLFKDGRLAVPPREWSLNMDLLSMQWAVAS